ncbi:carboxylesterase [Caldicoprobacter guelmensis]|uniref:acyl-CoA thioester hydrolase/BAAT C-terminal domain-containing protein n=1 Tax=Caldicoprobacter guelmensis TaxID=1170224 RepID=UPI001959673E|nr:carboxylesterase [Caldicoprobacter guelmensis]
MVFYKNGRVGCFILHGINGDQFGVETLCSYLEEQGYSTYRCGIGIKVESVRLFNVDAYLEWLYRAERDFKDFCKQYDYVVVIGISVGGLIGILLAERYMVDALITINTPIYLSDAKRFLDTVCREGVKGGNSYFNRIIVLALCRLVGFNRLLNQVKRVLYRLRCPLLVIQGKKDDIVDWKSASYIYDSFLGQNKEIQYFPKSGHFIFLDCESPLVFIRMHQFIQKSVENRMLMEGYI